MFRSLLLSFTFQTLLFILFINTIPSYLLVYNRIVRKEIITLENQLRSINKIGPLLSSKLPNQNIEPDRSLLKNGSLIEYIAAKKTKQLALVINVYSDRIEAMNDARMNFFIPYFRISHIIPGEYAFGDLVILSEDILHLKLETVETAWESFYTASIFIRNESSSINVNDQEPLGVTVHNISQIVFDSTEPLDIYRTLRLLSLYADTYFEFNDDEVVQGVNTLYYPLTPNIVQERLKEKLALQEFKSRYYRALGPKSSQKNNATTTMSSSSASASSASASSGGASGGEIIPPRIIKVLAPYQEGLIQIIGKTHPWTVQGYTRKIFDNQVITKGEKLLNYLKLAPTAKNAKKILEPYGLFSSHANIEKYIMNIRDEFPEEVLKEAKDLLLRSTSIADPDERIRRDLRYLGSYAIDREGASEIDDAVSIETIVVEPGESGVIDTDNLNFPTPKNSTSDRRTVEKLWVHIADVSRWIRPGSQLSVEAERRMTSVYMPDERISLFPEQLSSELLSLGAKRDSYAISCGIVLNDKGEVVSYEICPSKIRITRKLSYTQLDAVLKKSNKIMSMPNINKITGASTISLSQLLSGPTAKRKNSNHINLSSKVTKPPPPPPPSSPPSNKPPPPPPPPPTTSVTLTRLPPDPFSAAGPKWLDHTKDSPPMPNPFFTLSNSLSEQTQHNLDNIKEIPESQIASDLKRLNDWAIIRHKYRENNGALDEYLRHKTELSISVKKDPKDPFRCSVMGFMSWSNATSVSLVTEYMILMCQTIGSFCKDHSVPVWYKVQEAPTELNPSDYALKDGEVPFTRAARIIRYLKPAVDSKSPAIHCSSGSLSYVQCTSPIRRYHDLYNHFRLKVALHAASMGPEWSIRAVEEAGISRLDNMASEEERLVTLRAVRLVTRQREQFWLQVYIDKLIAASTVFTCMIYGLSSDSTLTTQHSNITIDGNSHAFLYEALILQLGSFSRYRLLSLNALNSGEVVKALLYPVINSQPKYYLCIPEHTKRESIPEAIQNFIWPAARNKISKLQQEQMVVNKTESSVDLNEDSM